jgi:hypothetical protein
MSPESHSGSPRWPRCCAAALPPCNGRPSVGLRRDLHQPRLCPAPGGARADPRRRRHPRHDRGARSGRPSAAAGVTRDEAWIYSAYRVRNYTYQAPEVIERDVVAISFDADGVVSNVERFGLEDGQLVQLVAPCHGKLGARFRLLPAIDAQPGPCRSGQPRRLGDAVRSRGVSAASHVDVICAHPGRKTGSNRSIGMLTLSRGRYNGGACWRRGPKATSARPSDCVGAPFAPMLTRPEGRDADDFDADCRTCWWKIQQ